MVHMEKKVSDNQILSKEIIDRLIDPAVPQAADVAARYATRSLKSGAMVTRVAPSPTGFMHIGGVFTAMVNERFAHQTGGVFFVRIEDTDQKREVEGATELVIKSLAHFGIPTDEGLTLLGDEAGAYGPYTQSAREDIYKAFVRHALEQGFAYPCFATEEELDAMRAKQEEQKIRPGYYGDWAMWRDATEEKVREALDAKKPFAIRFRSSGSEDKKVVFEDAIKGHRELPENDQDVVIMKSAGLPTYHFAHVVDDHLMGTTHVIRGDEWFISVPLHLQLFEAMGWTAPIYGHLAPIQKIDDGARRKLSKRKDPEASATYYDDEGYPTEAVIEYLLNLANSNFEDWRKANPTENNRAFEITFKKLGSSAGALLDLAKLQDIGKTMISAMSAEEVFTNAVTWARKYDTELLALLEQNAAYAKQILDIERSGVEKRRKDIAKWSDVKNEIVYFFDNCFALTKEEALVLLDRMDEKDTRAIIASFMETFDERDNRDAWFEKMKAVGTKNGYAENGKLFKAEPEKYKGTVGDVAKVFRVLLTGRVQTPDLWSVMQVMGKARIMKRVSII